mgnify:CR=1 FL=1
MINLNKYDEIDITDLIVILWQYTIKHNFFLKISFSISLVIGLFFNFYVLDKYMITKYKLKNLNQIYIDFNLQELDLIENHSKKNENLYDNFKRNILLKEYLLSYSEELKSNNKIKNIRKIDEVKIYIDDILFSFRYPEHISENFFKDYIYFIGQITFKEYKKNYIQKLNKLIDDYKTALNLARSKNLINQLPEESSIKILYLSDLPNLGVNRLEFAIKFLNTKKEQILLQDLENNFIEKKFDQSEERNKNIFLSFVISLGSFIFMISIFIISKIILKKIK